MIQQAALTQAAIQRNQDRDCLFNRRCLLTAQRISFGEESEESFIVTSAARIFLKDYDPAAKPLPLKVYYSPHTIGKPGDFIEEYQELIVEDELDHPWFQ